MNSALRTLLSLAFFWASYMAGFTISMPMTSLAFWARNRVMVPVPQ